MLPPSMKPYLLRAIYDWCVDQNYTPHIVVRVDEHCRVPMQYVRDGDITLNVGPLATKDFFMDNEWVGFTARFGGVAQMVSFPITAVLAIYARETQEGMGFEVTRYEGNTTAPQEKVEKTPQKDEKTTKRVNPFRLVD
ncbi:ClpXP protease specificity-enhancing factor [Pelistega ratti]|uniref:ClpXP protease specificity-enhancing factor n=1 Tax=Pelistega ratti TaxID=2652177 RepID=UPI001358E348|nr:ClpXP protease specificity-enhancing factor [Pelistega ratti]